jgi:DNA-directed RNA polymerase subunit RPC12/RpoP
MSMLIIDNNNSMAKVNIEAECKNCSHDMSLHSPTCSRRDRDHICGCERPQYYGAVISDTNVGWTEFHCNKCGNLIGFLNTIDENIYEMIEDEAILCTKCIAIKK